MALTTYLIYKFLLKLTRKAIVSELVGGIVGSLVMAIGYFIYEILFFTTSGVAIASLPWNILQGAVGIIIAIILMRILNASKILEKIRG